jgi:uncharacterized membrane protein
MASTLAGEAALGREAQEPAPATRPRLESIDLLRGIVMVLMALDHVRDFFTDVRGDPLNLETTTVPLFFTRWVTHFCAPVFVFLAGTGAYLTAERGKTKPQLAWFLLTRGLWLVVLELTVVHLSWFFNFEYMFVVGQVIWAIGWSMVLMSGLVFLPTWAVALIGVGLVAGHNLVPGTSLGLEGRLRDAWTVLMTGPLTDASVPLGEHGAFVAAYPILPWLGIMAAGYGFGAVYSLRAGLRRRCLVVLGATLTLLFVLLRVLNDYGDPRPWTTQQTNLLTALAFLNCQKYPPSLLYTLMTLGPAILALAWFDRGAGWLGRPFVVFGQVPLFYYLLHAPLIHLVALGVAWLRYDDISFLLNHPLVSPPPEGYGYGLPVVYLIWVGVVIALYFPCRWFAGVKRRRREAWLSYL